MLGRGWEGAGLGQGEKSCEVGRKPGGWVEVGGGGLGPGEKSCDHGEGTWWV